MALNLIRNARMFFTTNVNAATGAVQTAGFTASNTREIQVLDGLSFSQATGSETITVNEAGDTPVRGQRLFNTSLEPVEITFSTYMRPYKDTSGGSVNALTWDATTVTTVQTGALTYTNLLTSYPANIVTASATTQPYLADYGLNTFVYATTAPTGGVTATFAPIFGADPANANYQKLIGVYVVNPGSGYTTAPTITIVDPDSGAEAISLVTCTVTAAGTVTITCEEDVLWEAFATGRGNPTAWTPGSASSGLTMAQSGKNQMLAFGVIIVLDQTAYVIDNCALDQASIDFGLDAIATIAWTARGTTLRSFTSTELSANNPTSGTVTFSGTYFSAAGQVAKRKNLLAHFLANKLSSVELASISVSGAYGGGSAATYSLALTGGNITLANNVTYLTPANLGVVNQPFTYFTGTRAVSGTLNCYLKTGTLNSAGLLNAMLEDPSNVEPAFSLTLHIGGGSTATTRVKLAMPSVVLQIPTLNTEQVVSTTINFTGQGLTGTAFDLEAKNELTVDYFAA